MSDGGAGSGVMLKASMPTEESAVAVGRSDLSASDVVRQSIEGPIWNPILKRWVGNGELDYERYLRTRELLSLQTKPGELSVAEEMLFQITHQAQELWLKLLAFEGARVVDALDGGDLFGALGCIERMIRVARTLEAEIHVLDTLTPRAFQEVRRNLGSGSGQESPGYNAARLAAAEIGAALSRLLERRGLDLLAVYKSAAASDLERVCEALVDLDEAFQIWLVAHYMLVRRTIGVDRAVQGLDGYPTTMLVGRMTQPLFRDLWSVRVALTKEWRREGGFAPGADRSEGARADASKPR